MIAFDYTILIQIVAFLVFWFLLTKLLFAPFLGLLRERERRTEGIKGDAAALREEGERLRKQYEDAVAQATDDGRALKEGIVLEGRRLREQLLTQAREESSRRLGAVRQEIQKELRRERELVAGEAEAIGRQMAEKILGRKIG